MSRLLDRDLITGAALMAFAVLVYFYLIPNYVTELESGAMSPKFFPRLSVILIGLGGALLVLQSALHRGDDADPETSPETNPETAPRNRLIPGPAIYNPAITIAAFAAFIVLFGTLGFIVAAPFLVAGLAFLFGERRPLFAILTAVVATAVIYVVFNYGLNLSLE